MSRDVFPAANPLPNHSSNQNQQSESMVQWRGWTDDAFNVAVQQNRPVFLAICERRSPIVVKMVEENFEDDETAEFLNRNFVCVWVDAAERPDLEDEYLESLRILGAEGGRGLVSIFLNPQGQPFLGGGFFPREASRLSASFLDVCNHALQMFSEESEEINRSCRIVNEALNRTAEDFSLRAVENRLSDLALDTRKMFSFLADSAAQCLNSLEGAIDRENGGFGGAPRFLRPDALAALLASEDKKKSAAAILTFDKIRCGAIADQVDGGIFSSSADARWMQPSLEKTLADNAQMLPLYAQAATLLRDLNPEKSSDFVATAQGIFDFLEQSLKCPDSGLYFSAEFADLDNDQGGRFVFDFDEVAQQFQSHPEKCEFALSFWGLSRSGNFKGANVLSRPSSLLSYCTARGIEIETGRRMLNETLSVLRQLRQSKPSARRDERVFLSSNALAACGLLRAGAFLGDNEFIECGLEKLDLIWSKFVKGAEPPAHFVHMGKMHGQAFADGLAALLNACTEAFAQTGSQQHLERARQVVKWIHALCVDPAKGTLFFARAVSRLGSHPLRILDGRKPSPAELIFLGCRNFLNHASSQMDVGFSIEGSELKMWEALELVALATFGSRATTSPHLFPAGLSEVLRACRALERV
ncbi:MAG: hypothetical protein RI953_978 [Pseudomonadota bacterium]|jgi:uncharacterized protein YyaL (SSP411 family)